MGDMMSFPESWEMFLHGYEFDDAGRQYTNGARGSCKRNPERSAVMKLGSLFDGSGGFTHWMPLPKPPAHCGRRLTEGRENDG